MDIKWVLHRCEEVMALPIEQANALKWIEACGRIAYRSEDKIGPGSDKKLINMLHKLGHWSVFGHSNITLRLKSALEISNWKGFIYRNPHESSFHRWIERDGELFINGNFTAWMKTMLTKDRYLNFLQPIFKSLPFEYDTNDPRVVSSIKDIPEQLIRVTCIYTTNRLITHELVRHRPVADYTQESTRYCIYRDEVHLCEHNASAFENAMPHIEDAFNEYNKLLKSGLSREYARGVLPHLLAAKIAVTHDIGNEKYGWKYIYKLRTSKGAAPQIRDLMYQTKDKIKHEYGIDIAEG